MKLLTDKNKVYFLLLEIIFAFSTLVIASFFVEKIEPDFLARSLVYQITSFILTVFIYLNLSTINKKLKIAAILMISKFTINFAINLFTYHFASFLLMNSFFLDILKIIVRILEIPFVYFFYKGFSHLVSNKTGNNNLAKKWEKLLVANLILVILNLLTNIINYTNLKYDFFDILAQIPVVALLISLIFFVFAIVLIILEIVYVIKTAKEL